MKKEKGFKRILGGCLFGLCLLFAFSAKSQQIRLDNLKEQFSVKNLVRVNGGIAANSVFYTGDNAARQPFMWVLTGNINIHLLNQFNIPFSYNLNNLGSNYTYPTLPNRLSLHPTYKWVTAHVGDVSMSFSPYTLSGHQFTGGGVELKPGNFPLKAQFMCGRLLKETEYDARNGGIVAYRRLGYGGGIRYEKENYQLGTTLFHAHDDENSLLWKPDSLQVYPQSNLAFSWDVLLRLFSGMTLKAEYGMSILTRDRRLPSGKRSNSLWFLEKNASSVYYHALKVNLDFLWKKNTFGLGYERVDPDYRSLGGYYFTNDLENFTFNYARPFWQDKITLALNLGIQRDNLDHTKREQTSRWVVAGNLNIVPNEQWNVSVAYSGFQSYTNIRSQFDYINATHQYENLDTLDFTQLSQNLSMTVNYTVSENDRKSQNLNLAFSFQEAADKRGGMIHPGSVSRFYNGSVSYALLFLPSSVRVTLSANTTYNTAGSGDMLTYGPNAGVSSKFFDKKVSAGISSSYNISSVDGKVKGKVLNVRGSSAWRFLKKHSTNLSLVYQNRSGTSGRSSSDFTTALNYTYSF